MLMLWFVVLCSTVVYFGWWLLIWWSGNISGPKIKRTAAGLGLFSFLLIMLAGILHSLIIVGVDYHLIYEGDLSTDLRSYLKERYNDEFTLKGYNRETGYKLFLNAITPNSNETFLSQSP